MALEKITNPPVLDTTGQNIVSKLDQIKDAVQPINPCLDIDISIPANGWSSSSPYTYTYSNNHISSGCSVKVDFLEGAQSTKVLYLEFEKVVNGVRFTSATKPTTAIPVRLHILNADATSSMATTADEVSTSAVSGSANVEDALGSLSEQIGNIGGLIARNTTSGSTMSGTLDLTNAHAIIAVINVHSVGDISMVIPLDGTQSVYGHIKYNDNFWASVKLQLTASNGQYTISFDAKGSSVSTFDYAYFYRL